MMKRIALSIPALRRIYQERQELREQLAASQARINTLSIAASPESPFWHYHSTFDAVATMRRHAVTGQQATAGLLTNFLGVKIDPKFLPEILAGRGGQVEDVPIPANWHADIAEWAAALRAVDLAKGSFTMAELGCGWGCWMNNTGVAARNRGLDVRLIGVEGDVGHVEFAHEACALNGFEPAAVTVHHGIAAARAGIALFPRQLQAGLTWGLAPIFGATPEQSAEAIASGTHDQIPMISLRDMIGDHAKLDLLHVDIQGGEADLVDGAIETLNQKVAFLLIGTHSREIEGRLFKTLLDAGWALEIERPAILQLGDAGPIISVDGVQGWRNPRLH